MSIFTEHRLCLIVGAAPACGVLPGAVFPGVSSAAAPAVAGENLQARLDAEQQAIEEQELLGALAVSLSEQQVRDCTPATVCADAMTYSILIAPDAYLSVLVRCAG